jgi:hypothetical protein
VNLSGPHATTDARSPYMMYSLLSHHMLCSQSSLMDKAHLETLHNDLCGHISHGSLSSPTIYLCVLWSSLPPGKSFVRQSRTTGPYTLLIYSSLNKLC